MMVKPYQMMKYQENKRQFSSYYRVLTGQSAHEKLLEYQKTFEIDPNNVESAFYYFRVR
jgi:hypothetical protein